MYYRYYDLNDQPIKGPDAVLKWGRLYEKEDRRIKQQYTRLGYFVSTVWLGMNYQYDPKGPPMIYETVVFRGKNRTDVYSERYSTKKEALEGHKRAYRLFNNPFFVAFNFIVDKTWSIRRGLRNFWRSLRREFRFI